MSDDQGTPGRRRRRRRRNADESGGGERAPRHEPSGGERAPRHDAPRPERAPRKEPVRPERAPRPERGPRPERPTRSGRRTGGERGRRKRPSRAEQPPARTEQPAERTREEVDAGWELDPAAESPPPGQSAPRAETADDLDDERTQAWGDDTDAPEPGGALAADLPADPAADDPDPVTADLESTPEQPAGGPAVRNVVGVVFARAGKIYLYDAGDDEYAAGEEVVVEAERGVRLGTVAIASARQPAPRSSLRRILRRPSPGDRRQLDQGRERADDALRAARERARELGLPVKLFRAEASLGGNKITIYYSSEEKVDIRRLARELGTEVSGRLELRQTGVRDEAKLVGGIGSCGLELCCSTWLPAFVPVSIKNAKDQGLVLNPAKVSGQCGRLKCCLVYEQETYAAMRKGLPKLGKRVIAEGGEGRVVEVDVLRQRVRVSHGQGEFRVYEASEVKPMFPPQQGRKPQ